MQARPPAAGAQVATPHAILTASQARRLASGHPWILAEGLAEGRRGLVPGACVLLADGRGRPLGTALVAPGEAPALRLWSREGEPVSARSVAGRFAAAWGRRAGIRAAGDTDAYRVAHGEADGLPGLFADIWAGWLALDVQTAAWEPWLPALLEAAGRLARPKGVVVRRRHPRDSVEVWGGRRPPEEVEVRELGLRFLVRPTDAKPGLFPDERENRAWLAGRLAGLEVLNAFAFTGAFTVACAKAGATVTSLDLSAPALERLRGNLRLNGIPPAGHPCVRGEALTAMAAMTARGRRFGAVLMDPPAFSRQKGGATWDASRDYPRLAEAACRALVPEGWLAAAVTAHDVPAQAFEKMLVEGAGRAGRALHVVARRGAPEDFPALQGFPEGNHLKFVAARVG